jgi:nucleotide-binding universal stress UspA family protein
MKKILIPYDMSGASRKAMSFALELAKGSKSELVVLFVRSKYDDNFIKEAEVTEDEAKNKVKEMIKNAIKTVVRSGIKVEGVILKGDVAEKIIEYSDDNNIDLIIMGAKGITNSEKYKLGSVAEKVARYSSKSVLIAR